jgi:CRP-like cAMP-binding protein
LFPEGGAGSNLYFVADGVVELRHEKYGLRLLHSAGSVVAGAAVLGRDVQNYAASTVTPTVLLRIRDEDFFDLAEEHFGLTRAALAYLVGEREPLLKLSPPRD